ncbi:MAG: aromatic ring-hydroxylating dioxygenase subunit alpha [Pseudomonadota bacterium]
MGKYGSNPHSVRELVKADAVHRDVYTSEEVYKLEMKHLFRRAWIFVGHDSQVPDAGHFYTTQIGDQPIVMVRGADGQVHVLLNRCAHKGAKVVSAQAGRCDKFFSCPYHGWTYHLDGSNRAQPLARGYKNTKLMVTEAANGMAKVSSTVNYRGFVFCRLSDDGPDFHDYFGESLTSIDNMVDRSPEGRLEVAGGVLRYDHNCNWKMFVENLNDTMHPMVAHASSAGTAKAIWDELDDPGPPPMVIEQFVPFVAGYKFMDDMGVKIYPNGHSYTGVNVSIHSNYSPVEEYNRRMIAAYGEQRAQAILGEVRHNTVYYPTLTIKGAIQAIRVARPLAADRTVLESWTFRLVGAPDELLERTLMYSRLINSPTSVVGHDDLHCYRAIQEGLAADGNDWVSLHRGYDADVEQDIAGTYNGHNEVSMRGQFKAWRDIMTQSMGGG